jgi:uncharacterized membrane protein YqiK
LVVPYYHSGLSKFENGVPKKQVRDLSPVEQKWDFWTSSTAFYPNTPKTRGLVAVPVGESWVVERFGKYSRTLNSGNHFLLPFVDSVKVVKLDSVVSMGVFAPGVATKNGTVDAYAVAYFKVVDPSQVILW